MLSTTSKTSVQVERNASQAKTTGSGKIFPFLVSRCSTVDPRSLRSFEEVDRRLKEVISEMPFPHHVDETRGSGTETPNRPRFVTTSVLEHRFVGRAREMEELLGRLTSNESADDRVVPFSVISIVGMGGIGKTSLAQEVYDHPSVDTTFSLKAWYSVSMMFDLFAITRGLLQRMAPSPLNYEGKDLNSLQDSLREQLSGNKFLLVLDDIWNDNYEELQSLLKPFYSGSRGSRILLTTRNIRIPRLMGDRNPMLLQALSLEDSLELFAYHSRQGLNLEMNHPLFQEIEKCKGHPLSLKLIGGFLRFEPDVDKWSEVIRDLEGGYADIFYPVMLSYMHLPVHLKRCFAACLLFPDNYLFNRDEVTNLWTVLGLFHSETSNTHQDLGTGEYLDELEARSLLHRIGNEENRYSMHDLVRDSAKLIVGERCFSYNVDIDVSGESPAVHDRHASFLTRYFERCLSSRMDEYRSMKKLRTFVPLQSSAYLFPNISFSDEALNVLIMGMKCLRVLSLRCFQIRSLPSKIGDLKLLRSIDVSYSLIEVMPDSVCDLTDLEYLLLQGCTKLKKLPCNIHKLTKLLHLDITGANRLREMPKHIGDLINLEILSTFVVGKENSQGLKELGPLQGLKRGLHICNLGAVEDIEDAKKAGLQQKVGISKLSFDFRSTTGRSSNEGHQFFLLDQLKPPQKIECFKIFGYRGKKFPPWLSNPCMDNVVSLTIEGCTDLESLPALGQLPSLKELSICGLDKVSKIGPEFHLPNFRSLHSLTFWGMLAWDEWSFGDNENYQPFTCLHQLLLVNCPKLKTGLPRKLESLSELDIRDCPLLETSGDSLSLPSLGVMYFESCNKDLLKRLVGVTSMTKLTIRNVPQLDRFDGSTWVSLEEMHIHNCPQLKAFMHWNGGEQGPPKLKRLVIRDCKKLKKLPHNLCSLESLKEIIVSGCRKLSSLSGMELTPMLSKVELADCPNLRSSQFLGKNLRESLEELTLKNLQKLESIEDLISEPCRKHALRRLNIGDCQSLKRLPNISQHLSSLSELCISHCKGLDLQCFPDLPCKLSKFQLVECPRVMALPDNMHGLESLKEIDIRSCACITSLPEGGFLPKLEWLRIGSCDSLKQPLEDWGLPKLTALKQLHIVGGMECLDKMICFPCANDGNAWARLLPSSLVVLDICFMDKLEGLASGLRSHLTSLKELSIGYCGKMRDLPKDGLPDSLEMIEISGCDLLGKRCSQPNGRYWPLLRLIPEVIIY